MEPRVRKGSVFSYAGVVETPSDRPPPRAQSGEAPSSETSPHDLSSNLREPGVVLASDLQHPDSSITHRLFPARPQAWPRPRRPACEAAHAPAGLHWSADNAESGGVVRLLHHPAYRVRSGQ